MNQNNPAILEPESTLPANNRYTDVLSIESVLDLLNEHEAQAARVINMVPSENATSSLAKLPMVLDVYHRYFFNASEAPGDWHFRGSQDVAGLETRFALPLLRELTGAAYVNLRPLSGLSGMAMILSALGGPAGGYVMTVSPAQGGHYATAALAQRLGLKSCFMTGPDAHTIDYQAIGATIRAYRPALVYVDQSNCLFPADVRKIVGAVRDAAPETLIHVDGSHWLGFILGGVFPNPLTLGADSFGGSTHKSFPGPQKAIVATNRKDLSEKLYAAQYEMISSHHFASVVSLGIALLEFKECGGSRYAARIVRNTRRFGSLLAARGIAVEAADRGFSSGHQLWIRTAPSNVNAHQASHRLYGAGILVNTFPELPGIAEPVIRIGLNEATYHGLPEAALAELADIFAAAVLETAPVAALAARTAQLRSQYQDPFSFSLRDPALASRVLTLLQRTLIPQDPAAVGVLSQPAATVPRE